MPNSILHPRSVLFAAVLVSFLSLSLAEVPHSFSAGEPAVAAHINISYRDLDERVIDLSENVAAQSKGINWVVAVSGDDSSGVFLDTSINSHSIYILTGVFDGSIRTLERIGIRIRGDDDGSEDDGAVLLADFPVYPYAAIGVWESKDISLENLIVDATTVLGAIRNNSTGTTGARGSLHPTRPGREFLC